MAVFVTDAEVMSALSHPALVAELRDGHVAHAKGDVRQPVPAALPIPDHLRGADVRHARHVLMSAASEDLTVVKVLLDAPARRDLGEPAQRSVVSVYDVRTGDCLAVLDGRTLTRMRTAAATALAVVTLARPGVLNVGLVGAGALAAEHVAALTQVVEVDRLLVWARRPEAARDLAARAADAGAVAEVAGSIDELMAASDAVITTTPAVEPFIHAGHLHPGMHVSAVGSPPRPGHRELLASALLAADVVAVDDAAIATHESAQVLRALEEGLSPSCLVEIGAVLAGQHPGRTTAEQVTVHNSIGVALQDLAAVRLVLRHLGITEGGRTEPRAAW